MHFSPQLVYVIPLQLVLLHILKEDVASTDILIQPVPRDVIESINPEPGSQDAQITRVNLTLHNGLALPRPYFHCFIAKGREHPGVEAIILPLIDVVDKRSHQRLVRPDRSIRIAVQRVYIEEIIITCREHQHHQHSEYLKLFHNISIKRLHLLQNSILCSTGGCSRNHSYSQGRSPSCRD